MHADSLTFGGKGHLWEQLLREHIRMTDLYIRRPGLPSRARSLIRQVHTRDTLKMAIRAARRRELSMLSFYSIAGMRRDPLWAARPAKRAVTALVRRIARSPFRHHNQEVIADRTQQRPARGASIDPPQPFINARMLVAHPGQVWRRRKYA